MDKKSVSDQVASPSSESHGLLRGLMDALHRLVIMISSRLRHTQIHRSSMGDAKGGYDIGKKLRSHVEKISADSQPDTKSRAIREGTARGPNLQRDTAATAQEFNRIAEHSKKKAVSQLLPRMSEQLQSTTMGHINISLILAKEGNTDGARLHIDLAENAMHAASRFMSHEEYEIFEQKVDRRLESIIDSGRPNDSAT